MQIGAYIPGVGWTYDELRDVFVEAERLGFDVAWTMDNSVGPMESIRELPVPDAWTVLPGLAEATESIRLGTLVTPVGRRPFALLAKTTSVFDEMSHGRLDLGIGAGDHADYFEPWGQEYPPGKERVDRLREQIEVLKLMWTQDRSTFEGEFVRLNGAINNPKPVQKPHPPIWIGLTRSRRLMPQLAARYADGINIYLPDPKAREMLEIFSRYCEEVGRDPDAIPKSRNVFVAVADRRFSPEELAQKEVERGVGSYEDVLANIVNYENPIIGPADYCLQAIRDRAEGFDQVIVNFAAVEAGQGVFMTSAGGFMEAMGRFADEVMPKLRS